MSGKFEKRGRDFNPETLHATLWVHVPRPEELNQHSEGKGQGFRGPLATEPSGVGRVRSARYASSTKRPGHNDVIGHAPRAIKSKPDARS
jgi:hypothetical protein